jgi:hypothetical protein
MANNKKTIWIMTVPKGDNKYKDITVNLKIKSGLLGSISIAKNNKSVSIEHLQEDHINYLTKGYQLTGNHDKTL